MHPSTLSTATPRLNTRRTGLALMTLALLGGALAAPKKVDGYGSLGVVKGKPGGTLTLALAGAGRFSIDAQRLPPRPAGPAAATHPLDAVAETKPARKRK